MGESPCKKQCSVATFFQVIQPCLKISAQSFNSSNEARAWYCMHAGVPNEDDDRVLDGNILTMQTIYLHPKIAIHFKDLVNVKSALFWRLLLLLN